MRNASKLDEHLFLLSNSRVCVLYGLTRIIIIQFGQIMT